jgi:hypothetical protein
MAQTKVNNALHSRAVTSGILHIRFAGKQTETIMHATTSAKVCQISSQARAKACSNFCIEAKGIHRQTSGRNWCPAEEDRVGADNRL